MLSYSRAAPKGQVSMQNAQNNRAGGTEVKEFTIGKNDAGQRLDRWLAKAVPLLPAPLAQKYIRLKRVKVNGKGSKRDARLNLGDVLQLYINDEFFDTPTPENAYLSIATPKLDILYEDENLLLANKQPGKRCRLSWQFHRHLRRAGV